MRRPACGSVLLHSGRRTTWRRCKARGLDPEPLAGSLEAFKYGMPPEGGFAIGLERWVAQLVRAANIREMTLFPRDLHRLTP